MLIIAGTSLTVFPAANLVCYFMGAHIVVINREEIGVSLHPEDDIFICASLGEVFSKITI